MHIAANQLLIFSNIKDFSSSKRLSINRKRFIIPGRICHSHVDNSFSTVIEANLTDLTFHPTDGGFYSCNLLTITKDVTVFFIPVSVDETRLTISKSESHSLTSIPLYFKDTEVSDLLPTFLSKLSHVWNSHSASYRWRKILYHNFLAVRDSLEHHILESHLQSSGSRN
jgi:hypothetical protein